MKNVKKGFNVKKILTFSIILFLSSCTNSSEKDGIYDTAKYCDDIEKIFHLLKKNIFENSPEENISYLSEILSPSGLEPNIMEGYGITYNLKSKTNALTNQPTMEYAYFNEKEMELNNLELQINPDCLKDQKVLHMKAKRILGAPKFISETAGSSSSSWEYLVEDRDTLRSTSVLTIPSQNLFIISLKTEYLTIEEN